MSSAASRPPQATIQMANQMASQSVSQLSSQPVSSQSSEPASGQMSDQTSGQSTGQSTGQTSGQTSGQSTSQTSGSTARKSLRQPPSRPQLMGPPARPKPPAPAPTPVAPAAAAVPAAPVEPQPLGPIPVPSERMQYRAIGLLKGKYVASEEQFNRGNIALEDDTLIDAVLLGRVTSLIKKHVDLECAHLWVVYPRTLYNEENEPALHMQIVGVWEPETLNARKNDDSEKSDDDSPKILSSAEAEAQQCDRFSLRGEIAKYSEDKSEIVVNIVQKSKSETAKPKRPFKLLVSGQLTGRTTGYFWDLDVKREGGKLVLQSAKSIAVVPPKKKSKEDRKNAGARRRPAAGKPRSTPVPKPKAKAKDSAEKEPAEAMSETSLTEEMSAEASVAAATVDQTTVTAPAQETISEPSAAESIGESVTKTAADSANLE